MAMGRVVRSPCGPLWRLSVPKARSRNRSTPVPLITPKESPLDSKLTRVQQPAAQDDTGKEISAGQSRALSQRQIPDKCKLVEAAKDGACLYHAVAKGLVWFLGALHSLIRFVSGFYASQFRLFVVQSCTSARRQRAHTGLLQGCPLAPTLSLCIGYLWSAFVASPQVEAGIYVDDRIMWVSQLSQDATTAARGHSPE